MPGGNISCQGIFCYSLSLHTFSIYSNVIVSLSKAAFASFFSCQASDEHTCAGIFDP